MPRERQQSPRGERDGLERRVGVARRADGVAVREHRPRDRRYRVVSKRGAHQREMLGIRQGVYGMEMK